MKITSIRLGPMVQRRDTDLHSFDQTYDILTRYLIFALGLIIIAKTSHTMTITKNFFFHSGPTS